MINILYYDCFSGISGDMHLGAMIDLGVPLAYLENEISRLPVQGYRIIAETGFRQGIKGISVKIDLNGNNHHHHRDFGTIKSIISESSLNNNIKSTSLAIFSRIAEAEAKIHGKSVDDVHFHEVGAVDSIIDIVGAAICLDYLKPAEIFSSPVELGSGYVKCAHGTFPVPAPATIEILKNIPVTTGNQPFESTTPTGAAILAAMAGKFDFRNNYSIKKIGYGLGHEQSDVPNVLRVLWVETEEKPFGKETSLDFMIECNIDDMTAENVSHVMNLLLEAGADDVFVTPIIMKKSRNASKLSILCREALKQKLIDLVFRETSTFGVRSFPVTKNALQRDIKEVETRYGKIRVKRGFLAGKMIKYKTEFDDCMKRARENNISIIEIYREVEKMFTKIQGI